MSTNTNLTLKYTSDYIVIENDGELDLNALRLIGASTKRGDDNYIGQYGSGLKYALAWLLRNDVEFSVYAGEREVKVTKVPTPLRGMMFDVIYIDDEATSLTTEMGPDWEAWQAFRELYCNALDEGSEDPVRLVSAYSGVAGTTAIVIKNEGEFKEVVSNFSHYFSKDTTVLFEKDKDKILEKAEEGVLRIFRRGILVLAEESEAKFDYDITDLPINEMRTPKYSWSWRQSIGALLYSCDNVSVIQQAFANSKSDIWLVDEGFVSTYGYKLTPAWVKAIGERKIATVGHVVYMQDKSEYERGGIVVLPDKVYNDLEAAFVEINTLFTKGSDVYTVLDKSQLQVKMLGAVIHKLNAFNIDVEFDIQVVDFVNAKTMGMALVDNRTILLSKKAFLQGEQYLMETVLEEWVHIEYAVEDETRAMQDVLLRLLAQKVMES